MTNPTYRLVPIRASPSIEAAQQALPSVRDVERLWTRVWSPRFLEIWAHLPSLPSPLLSRELIPCHTAISVRTAHAGVRAQKQHTHTHTHTTLTPTHTPVLLLFLLPLLGLLVLLLAGVGRLLLLSPFPGARLLRDSSHLFVFTDPAGPEDAARETIQS